MSGSRPSVGIRISAEGAEKVRRDLESLGPAGQKAFDTITRASSLAAPEMQKLGASVDVVQRAFIGMGGSMGRFGSVFAGVAGVAGGLTTGFVALGAAAALSGAAIAKSGDEAIATLARLTTATGSISAARDVYESLFQTSQKTGIAVAESAGAFSRFQIAAGEIGATRDQVLSLIAGLQKAAVVSGATAAEGTAAMQQLGQALASGKLNGDELRSLMENMPSLAQKLAQELGVGMGQLRKMGEEGQLTADRVFPALLKATEKMAADFDKMPMTMSRSFDILGSSMLNFTAKLDEALGLSQRIASAVKAAADAVNNVRAVVMPTEREQAAGAVDAARTRLQNLQPVYGPVRGPSADDPNLAPIQRAQLAGAETARKASIKQAEIDLRNAQQRMSEIEKEAQADRFGQFVTAENKRAEAFKVTSGLAFTAAELKLNDMIALDAKYLASIQVVDAAERSGAVSAERIATQRLVVAQDYYDEKAKIEKAAAGERVKADTTAIDEEVRAAKKREEVIATLDGQTAAALRANEATLSGVAGSRELAVALAVEAKLHQAGIPLIEKRTEAEKAAAVTIEARVRGLDRIKEAEKKSEEETKKTAAFVEKSWSDLGSIGERAMERVGDAAVQAMMSGEGRAVNFGNILRSVALSAAADLAKLALINPFLNWIMPTGTPRSTLAGAFGGGGAGGGGAGGGFNLSSMGSLGKSLSSGWDTLSSGGYFASGGGGFFGSPGVATGPLGEMTGATSGMFGTGGSFSMGSVGSTLGGIGAGFGIGSTLGGFIANSSAQRQNSQIGAGIGSVVGSIFGPVGSMIGGAIGGVGGGMIGPGESVKSYGLRLQSAGFTEGGANEMAGSLNPVSRKYYNESGSAVFQQADQVVAAVNAYLAQRNLQVGGVSIIGGNKNGPDGSGDAGSLSEAFTRLRFSAKGDEQLSSKLSSQVFDDPAKLQAFVEGFHAVKATIKDLTETSAQKLQKTLDAVGTQFDALGAKAREYGLSETGLADARARAIAQVQAQQNSAGQSLLADLAFGGQSALAPEQRYFAALSLLNEARGRLTAGGGVEEFAGTARQVLPVARDFLGTSERYASLVADVAGAVTSAGGDPAGLGALLQAQVDGGDAMRETFARYGERQLDVATATLSEFRRLASAIEALLARRTAA